MSSRWKALSGSRIWPWSQPIPTPKIAGETTALCSFCQHISPFTDRVEHHPRLRDFKRSAKSCPLCKMLLDHIEPSDLDTLQQDSGNIGDYAKVVITIVGLSNPPAEKAFAVHRPIISTRWSTYDGRAFIMTKDGRGELYSSRAIWQSREPVTWEQSLPVLRGWISECLTQHDACATRHSGPLPTRLLCVGSDSGRDRLRLIQADGVLDPASTRYVALSHCWGKVQHPLRTTLATLETFQQGIDPGLFPNTFSDAISITRTLGMAYVWIDALCIVQDDAQDWQREAGRMASVYSNAEFTVAATASADSEGGCLFPRQPAIHVAVRDGKSVGQFVHVRPEAGEAALTSSPLYQRGWVMQEMVLSRRTIHFAQDQLYWSCRCRMTSEDGLWDSPKGTTFYELSTMEAARRSWWTWVEDYTRRHLTRPSDKFAAFAGVTNIFPCDKPLAGIWEDDMHFGLLWCCQIPDADGSFSLPELVSGRTNNMSLRESVLAEGEFGSNSNADGIPSWSWASVEGVARSIFARPSPIWKNHPRGVFEQIKLLDYTLDWSGDPLTSTLLRAHLNVRGRLAFGVVAYKGRFILSEGLDMQYTFYWPFLKPRNRYCLWPDLESHERDHIATADCTFDSQPPPPGTRVLCLLVSTATTTEYCIRAESSCGNQDVTRGCIDVWKIPFRCNSYRHHFLIVERAGNTPLRFRRIGVGVVMAHAINYHEEIRKDDFFSGAEQMDVTLV